MEKKAEILAYHGWGANAEFWQPLQTVLPSEITFKTANRGYFGKPFYPRFDADTKIRVVFTHSYGLQWCNTAVLSKADFLVIFNGFGDFFPSKEKQRTVAKAGLDNMISNFEKDPEETLSQFYKTAALPNKTQLKVPTEFNKLLLSEDLNELIKTRFPLIDLDFGSMMIALDSAKDHVLLTPRGKEITAAHYQKKEVHVFENSGHLLPFVNPKDCWSYLSSIIPIFASYGNKD